MAARGEYAFITAIESCIDIAQHLCATSGWGPPSDNGDAVLLLGRHGVLPAELAESLRQAVGFRNVLVHDYVEADDAIVDDRLSELSELREFAAHVGSYLERVRT